MSIEISKGPRGGQRWRKPGDGSWKYGKPPEPIAKHELSPAAMKRLADHGLVLQQRTPGAVWVIHQDTRKAFGIFSNGYIRTISPMSGGTITRRFLNRTTRKLESRVVQKPPMTAVMVKPDGPYSEEKSVDRVIKAASRRRNLLSVGAR